MADAFQVLFGDDPSAAADDAFYTRLTSVEVEENADLPGAVQLLLPLTTIDKKGSEDISDVGDDRFKPYGRIAVVATPDGKPDACIFDGYILSHRIHLDRGTTAATLRVWGQDASCLMNLKDRVKEWSDKTDGQIANDIFRDYQFELADDNDPKPPADNQDDQNGQGAQSGDANSADGGQGAGESSGQHTEDAQTVMQRATDAQFLRDRARRTGRLFRVCCGEKPGANRGYFVKPSLQGKPAATLILNPPDEANVDALDFEWDVARPTRVLAQTLLTDDEAVFADTSESGLSVLDDRSLAEFTNGGQGDDFGMETRLTGTADSLDDLRQRAASVLREAGWFVRCEGEVELARVKAVMRAATVVQIDGAGQLHSGLYFVWSVRHTITAESHRMRFVLVRNAVGAASP
jgi:hypothetical protein